MKEQSGFCAEVENSLPLYVGGDLEADATAEIERHVALCTACAARAGDAGRARATLVSALRLRATSGPDLWSGVRAVLAEEGLIARPVSGSKPAPQVAAARAWRLQLVPVGLAAAAAIVFGVWLGSRFFAPSAPSDGTDRPTSDQNNVVNHVPVPAPVKGVPEPAVDELASQGGLRRLAPGEPWLRKGAEIFVPAQELYGNGAGPALEDPNAGSPVSLHRVHRGP